MAREYGRNSFLYGTNAPFLAQMYHKYVGDPSSVTEDWRAFFEALGENEARELLDFGPPEFETATGGAVTTGPATGAANTSGDLQSTRDSINALMLIRVHRVRGHLMANLDPLKLQGDPYHPELDPKTYGFGPEDYDRPIYIGGSLGFETATLNQIMEKLRITYCSNIGVEFMHIQDPDQKNWIQKRIEGYKPSDALNNEDREQVLTDLARAETFEKFLNVKYPGAKRFGLDGGESLIPALENVLRHAADGGVEEVVLGMAHRGRLSVLANIVQKPLRTIFAQFQGGAVLPDSVQGSGDVKYHLGSSTDREINGKMVHISLTANPSHLEAVNPVVLGKVRCKQALRNDDDRKQVMGILLHGDAAFAGQGLVGESLELSGLRGYQTGGTLHIIINNQIGFTTSPPHSRSSPYSSDTAKSIQAPIFHVNADDPEATAWVAGIAEDFRQEFAQDIIVDMICYRRHGHNEGDEPAFTQPLMYKAIGQHPSTLTLYKDQVVQNGTLREDQVLEVLNRCDETLKAEFLLAGDIKFDNADWLEGQWAGIKAVDENDKPTDEGALDPKLKTGVSDAKLKKIIKSIFTVPEGVNAHRKIVRQFDAKLKTIEETGGGVDWATGEALAFGSLLMEGAPVRLSGQDCGRGTFSQRHSVLIDQETEEKYVPLNNIEKGQSQYEVIDSPLAEASVLGFEYGYALADPHALVMWEGQFGDFANGAQMIIDQFISSGEVKWLRLCGLTMLLPHGYEGQGPEHSSARLERFLQLCAQKNMRVLNCTTPANYFHALRRQVRHESRKPLILMTPKSLLRHRLCVSDLKDMNDKSHFKAVIDDDKVTAKKVQRVVFCSGKVYYDLMQERENKGIEDIAIVRLEQFYPFPHKELIGILKHYKNADMVWCQEEPQNMGGWTFVEPRFERVLREIPCSQLRMRYIGRKAAAAPAVGSLATHLQNQERLVNEALSRENLKRKGLSVA